MKSSSNLQGDLPAAIGQPATRALYNAGIQRLEQLSAYTETELLKLHGVGPKALGVLRQALEARGLQFADPPPTVKKELQ